MEHVAILGASSNSDRYSYQAQIELAYQGHIVYPVSLKDKVVVGVKAFQSVLEIEEDIDTLTVYIKPDHFKLVVDDVIKLAPKRVIFNPGSEAPVEMKKVANAGILVQEACTLVLLSIKEFEDY